MLLLLQDNDKTWKDNENRKKNAGLFAAIKSLGVRLSVFVEMRHARADVNVFKKQKQQQQKQQAYAATAN